MPPDSSCVARFPKIDFALPPPPKEKPGPRDAVISTVAGDGAHGFPGSSGDGNLATQAQLVGGDVVDDAEGNLYILEGDRSRVRKVDASSGLISTAVGAPTGIASPPPGEASEVVFPGATALAIDSQGNLYVGGGLGGHHVITRVDTSGDATVIAGTGERGFSGDGGPATEAECAHPVGILVDPKGNVYVSDKLNNRVRRIDRHGIVTTVVGTGKAGCSGDGGPATEATVWRATRFAMDLYGDLYLSNPLCNRVRMVDPDGIITAVAGTGIPGYSGDGGPADAAELSEPSGITTLESDGSLYVADLANYRVRRVRFP